VLRHRDVGPVESGGADEGGVAASKNAAAATA
jgi:hypothetical protein